MNIPSKLSLPVINSNKVKALCELTDLIEDGLHRNKDVAGLIEQFNSEVKSQKQPEDFLTYYGSCSTEDFVKSALICGSERTEGINSDDLVALINLLRNELNSAVEQAYWEDLLLSNVLDPGAMDHALDDELSAEQALQRISEYKPILL